MDGQKTGQTAQIYIDLTALGMPVLGPIEYEVLAKEPVSYVIEKAVFGQSFETYGAAKETFGFSGTHRGTLDIGYYLASIDVRSTQGLQTLTGEYWTDYGGRGVGVVPVEMPVKYVAEMFCDRLAASRVYRGSEFRQADPWEFFQHTKQHAKLHDNTRDLLEDMLVKLRDEGEDAAFAYIRREILSWEGARRC
jgi:hypothetical protein